MSIIATTVVLEQVVVTSSEAIFRSPEDVPGVTDIAISRGVWDEMNSPTELTVTVRPGNHMADGSARVLR